MKMAFFSFLTIMISMIVVDGAWLMVMHKRLYAPQLGHLLRESIEIYPAVTFYLLFGIALNIFVVYPALKNNTGYVELLLLGFLFGMVTYGTYDLTNQATLKSWPWIITITDLTWGSFLGASLSCISTFITRFFYLGQ